MKKIVLFALAALAVSLAVAYSMASNAPGTAPYMPRTSGASINPFSGDIKSGTTAGPCVMDEASGITNPVFVPDCQPGTTTGIGGTSGTKVSVVIGGIAEAEVDANELTLSSGTWLVPRNGIYDDTGIVEVLDVIGGDSVPTISVGAAATTFAITRNVSIVDCDAGGNTIATITGGGTGVLATFIFVDADCTISNDDTHAADTVDLDAANDFTSADDSTLQLVHDGTSWYRITDSVN